MFSKQNLGLGSATARTAAQLGFLVVAPFGTTPDNQDPLLVKLDSLAAQKNIQDLGEQALVQKKEQTPQHKTLIRTPEKEAKDMPGLSSKKQTKKDKNVEQLELGDQGGIFVGEANPFGKKLKKAKSQVRPKAAEEKAKKREEPEKPLTTEPEKKPTIDPERRKKIFDEAAKPSAGRDEIKSGKVYELNKLVTQKKDQLPLENFLEILQLTPNNRNTAIAAFKEALKTKHGANWRGAANYGITEYLKNKEIKDEITFDQLLKVLNVEDAALRAEVLGGLIESLSKNNYLPLLNKSYLKEYIKHNLEKITSTQLNDLDTFLTQNPKSLDYFGFLRDDADEAKKDFKSWIDLQKAKVSILETTNKAPKKLPFDNFLEILSDRTKSNAFKELVPNLKKYVEDNITKDNINKFSELTNSFNSHLFGFGMSDEDNTKFNEWKKYLEEIVRENERIANAPPSVSIPIEVDQPRGVFAKKAPKERKYDSLEDFLISDEITGIPNIIQYAMYGQYATVQQFIDKLKESSRKDEVLNIRTKGKPGYNLFEYLCALDDPQSKECVTSILDSGFKFKKEHILLLRGNLFENVFLKLSKAQQSETTHFLMQSAISEGNGQRFAQKFEILKLAMSGTKNKPYYTNHEKYKEFKKLYAQYNGLKIDLQKSLSESQDKENLAKIESEIYRMRDILSYIVSQETILGQPDMISFKIQDSGIRPTLINLLTMNGEDQILASLLTNKGLKGTSPGTDITGDRDLLSTLSSAYDSILTFNDSKLPVISQGHLKCFNSLLEHPTANVNVWCAKEELLLTHDVFKNHRTLELMLESEQDAERKEVIQNALDTFEGLRNNVIKHQSFEPDSVTHSSEFGKPPRVATGDVGESTLFMKACQAGDVELMKFIDPTLADGDPRTKTPTYTRRNENNQDALMLAVISKNAELVKLLIEKGKYDKDRINELDSITYNSYSFGDNLFNNTIARLPGINKIGPSKKNVVQNNNILLYAYASGIQEIVTALVTAGAKNIEGKSHKTTLMAAVVGRREYMIDTLLIDKKAINKKTKNGDTALHFAAAASDTKGQDAQKNGFLSSSKIIEKLVAAGSKVDAKNKHGVTALHIAVSNGDMDALDALIKAGANLNIQDKNGNTALHIACEAQNIEMVQKLCSYYGIEHKENNAGFTPFMLTNLGFIQDQQAVENAKELEAQNKNKEIAEGIAPKEQVVPDEDVWNGHQEIAEILLAAGADPYVSSRDASLFSQLSWDIFSASVRSAAISYGLKFDSRVQTAAEVANSGYNSYQVSKTIGNKIHDWVKSYLTRETAQDKSISLKNALFLGYHKITLFGGLKKHDYIEGMISSSELRYKNKDDVLKISADGKIQFNDINDSSNNTLQYNIHSNLSNRYKYLMDEIENKTMPFWTRGYLRSECADILKAYNSSGLDKLNKARQLEAVKGSEFIGKYATIATLLSTEIGRRKLGMMCKTNPEFEENLKAMIDDIVADNYIVSPDAKYNAWKFQSNFEKYKNFKKGFFEFKSKYETPKSDPETLIKEGDEYKKNKKAHNDRASALSTPKKEAVEELNKKKEKASWGAEKVEEICRNRGWSHERAVNALSEGAGVITQVGIFAATFYGQQSERIQKYGKDVIFLASMAQATGVAAIASSGAGAAAAAAGTAAVTAGPVVLAAAGAAAVAYSLQRIGIGLYNMYKEKVESDEKAAQERSIQSAEELSTNLLKMTSNPAHHPEASNLATFVDSASKLPISKQEVKAQDVATKRVDRSISIL